MPDAVVFASQQDQVSAIMQICSQHKIPVTARGTGTGTTGASIPSRGGIVLSLERMNQILRVDPDNRVMVVEPGVTNQAIQQAAAEQGFFWPPDPTSKAVCTVGGNLAYNSAGPRAVKYGTPRDNTLGLRAVTADGKEIRTGVYTTKGVVGYDLTRLLIGSEGTLAIITEATLKLTPIPEDIVTLRVLYADIDNAAAAVARIMAQPITPCALEFIDDQAIELIRQYKDPGLPTGIAAMLMIEVDGPASAMSEACACIRQAAGDHNQGVVEFHQANTDEERKQLWQVRSILSPALRSIAPKKINEDIVVPVSRIPELINELKRLSTQHQIPIVNFGHAGNGNIHVNLLIDPDDPQQSKNAETCLDQVFSLVLRLDGTLSGEHGIGLVKRDFLDREIEPDTLTLMRQIKQVFDPDNILNPGKMLPEKTKD